MLRFVTLKGLIDTLQEVYDEHGNLPVTMTDSVEGVVPVEHVYHTVLCDPTHKNEGHQRIVLISGVPIDDEESREYLEKVL